MGFDDCLVAMIWKKAAPGTTRHDFALDFFSHFCLADEIHAQRFFFHFAARRADVIRLRTLLRGDGVH